ncbi:MAG: hypothetical protein OEO77_14485 [Acidimicrobiia bacterium]|nr:hypothetical protein [Acidimicrobiia bacterium]
MGRAERKIMAINDQLAALREERRLVTEELVYHRHLDDDARRDAAIGDAEDRALAYETGNDVRRFERVLAGLDTKTAKLETRRAKLLERLGDL